MGRYERAAKSSLKEATALYHGLVSSIKSDFTREGFRLEEELRDRVESVQKILNEVSSIQDAIVAGSSEVMRELEKSRKKLVKGGDREAMVAQILATAGRLGELRVLHMDSVARIQGVLARPPSAVDIIERMTKDLLKMSGSWESSAREIDESIAEVVDANPPLEMVSLSREINNNGYDVILAGDNRGQESIEAARKKIKELIGEE